LTYSRLLSCATRASYALRIHDASYVTAMRISNPRMHPRNRSATSSADAAKRRTRSITRGPGHDHTQPDAFVDAQLPCTMLLYIDAHAVCANAPDQCLASLCSVIQTPLTSLFFFFFVLFSGPPPSKVSQRVHVFRP